jgi:hypothetical protein
MRWTVLVAATVVAMATPALAQTETGSGFATGNDLYRSCMTPSDGAIGICSGYLQGVLDVQTALRDPNGSCLPKGTEISQVRDAVLAYLRDFPAVRSRQASFLVIAAVAKNWVCPAIPSQLAPQP